MKNLIIIDVQNDFLPGGSLEVPNSSGIVSVINGLQPLFDLVVATQDWHPQNHMSFASNHKNKRSFDVIKLNDLEQTLWPDHCVQESWGADFSPELHTNRIEAIIRKGTDPQIDSYSAFFDNNHQKSTGLTGYLKEKQVTDLYFCGLAADICVFYSMMDAAHAGFNVKLIEDATCPLSLDDFKNQKRMLIEKNVQFLNSSNLINNDMIFQ